MTIQRTVPLRTIAYARSGDKGSSANIGVIAYTQEGFRFLLHYLSVEKIDQYFKPLGVTHTMRYELPNLGALNFVLYDVLDRGGSRSLRMDAQGKALAQALLDMPIQIPEGLLSLVTR